MHKLNWVASELHKAYGPLFNPTLSEEGRAAAKKVRVPAARGTTAVARCHHAGPARRLLPRRPHTVSAQHQPP